VFYAFKSDAEIAGLFPSTLQIFLRASVPLKDANGYTALHDAARRGHVAAVEALLDAGAKIDQPGPESKSALALAAENGHAGVVWVLVKRGAKLEAKDKRRRTALLCAVKSGCAVEAGGDHTFSP
jgi:ankyrin repeat protein